MGVIVKNVISYLKDPRHQLRKEYKGSMETIALTNGKNGGMGYFPILWGIIIGDWLIARGFSQTLHVEDFRKMLGM